MFFNARYKEQINQLQLQLQRQQQEHQADIQHLHAEFQQQLTELTAEQQHTQRQDSLTATMLSGGSLLQQVRDELAGNATDLEHEHQALAELNQVFGATQTALQSLDLRATQITKDAEQSAKVTAVLDNTASSINQLISSIQEISDQTNLLALNAAIEAARAGDAGRGFAVVADEVRQLAGKAHQASSQIEQLIRQVIDQTSRIRQMVEQSQQSAAGVASSSAQIGDVVKKVIDTSTHMQKVIASSAETTFLNTVKLDHIVWKQHIYQHIQQKNQQATVHSHHNCRLGKWYFEGAGKQQYSHLRSYKNLDIPHKLVHDSGLLALKKAAEGDEAAMLLALQQMEHASHQVTDLIGQLLQEIN